MLEDLDLGEKENHVCVLVIFLLLISPLSMIEFNSTDWQPLPGSLFNKIFLKND